MKRILNAFEYHLIQKPFFKQHKAQLTERFGREYNGSIISHNCLGGDIYRDLEIEYLTPTAGLFIPVPEYVKFLNNLRRHLTSGSIEQIEKSKYYGECPYPIGLLDESIEIHFLHYKDFQEAVAKWYRRAERVNFNRLRVIMSERDGCEENHIVTFDSLNFEKKVCFTVKEYNYDSTHFIKPFSKLQEVPGADVAKYDVLKSFDLLNWL